MSDAGNGDQPVSECRGTTDGDEEGNLVEGFAHEQDLPTAKAGMALKKIVICADDFGISSGVNQGILELAANGRLSAVSCLAETAGFRPSASALLTLPVDIGLHVNFTEPCAAGSGFLSLPRLIALSYLRRLDRQGIVTAIERQCTAFEAALGRAPDFIDGHQHVHQLPIIRHALLEVIERRYAGKKLWLRSTRMAGGWFARSPYRRKAAIIAMLGNKALCQMVGAHGWRMNRRLLGVYDFSASSERYAELLRHWLTCAQAGDLLMCHPAKTATANDPLGEQRVREFAVFSDTRFHAWLAKNDVAVGRLSENGTGRRPENLPASETSRQRP